MQGKHHERRRAHRTRAGTGFQRRLRDSHLERFTRERLFDEVPDNAVRDPDRMTLWPHVVGLPPRQRAVIVLCAVLIGGFAVSPSRRLVGRRWRRLGTRRLCEGGMLHAGGSTVETDLPRILTAGGATVVGSNGAPGRRSLVVGEDLVELASAKGSCAGR